VVEQARLARVRLAGDADVRLGAQLHEALLQHRKVGAGEDLDVVAIVANEEAVLLRI
tara:strand:+ start:817 stop:987 length:171 start_codon:yes stop_codon:yes gene_type:complete